MMSEYSENIRNLVADTLVKAGSTFREDQIAAYRNAIAKESNPQAKWVLETILENARAAAENQSPLCDDSGIPHLILDVGPGTEVSAELLAAIQDGVSLGLQQLPGRPMAIMGSDVERLDQSGGLNEDSGAVLPAPIQIRSIDEPVLRLHVLMLGGGPAIRAKTYRVFHKHNVENILDEIVAWANEGVKNLGCSPCTVCVGIGRSHYEASSLMLQAQAEGRYDIQTEMEKEITSRINQSNIGALGLHGDTSVLATFMKTGPQRASGVRIVCMRPCCCFEPRVASVVLPERNITVL